MEGNDRLRTLSHSATSHFPFPIVSKTTISSISMVTVISIIDINVGIINLV
jgi:hypothetical protein